ncbi:acetyl-CoA carboxylase biotin carboxyl carrier protein [Aerosakkonema funiforme]|uniref:Biotin carboxyl carrier protein of acetyl-CoA carboxylase n=2 Tax=Oscillatoriophycideae TaxID=1301283 RepID=A0A926VH12_9CYAN|nr:acetyl-CoA carboxylase biotin carboxyl carrier protein [Aerosakkonema funiforme]MBD2183745.1 acetyl-CoA carboxylase biotin carboxyl carrier protein [Aerosakkonema funiforme FACHB-1375]
MELDFNELRELLTVLNGTDIAELTLKSADFELTVRKSTPDPIREVSEPLARVQPPVPPLPSDALAMPFYPQPPVSIGVPESATASSPTGAPPPQVEQKWLTITSPMVGTFYRSPAPDEPPFVEVGDRIRTGQTVCIIEAMKLMNEIEAEVSGQVMEILVTNGQPVEYGQVLMRVNPD